MIGRSSRLAWARRVSPAASSRGSGSWPPGWANMVTSLRRPSLSCRPCGEGTIRSRRTHETSADHHLCPFCAGRSPSSGPGNARERPRFGDASAIRRQRVGISSTVRGEDYPSRSVTSLVPRHREDVVDLAEHQAQSRVAQASHVSFAAVCRTRSTSSRGPPLLCPQGQAQAKLRLLQLVLQWEVER